MVLFFVKKAFFDTWDNLLSVALINIGFVAILALISWVIFLFEPMTPLFLAVSAAGVFLFNLYTGTVSGFLSEISKGGRVSLRSFPEYFKKIWKAASVISVISFIQLTAIIAGIPFYFSLGGIPGLIGIVTIFWISVFWWLAVQYFYPVSYQLKGNIKIHLKKSLILLLDNTFFTIFLGLYSLALTVLSVFTAFLLPGMGAVLLAHQTALRLRVYKYDFLEENRETPGKTIPWDELLFEEKERLGPRSVKGMIFPWKD